MNLNSIVSAFDDFFRINDLQPDMPFSQLVPAVYQDAGINLERYFEKRFLQNYHGLMTCNGEIITKIFNIVFLSDEMVEKVLAYNVKDILLVSHHPLAMETSNRGFLPLSRKNLREMQKRRISVYVLHTPLDVHDKISTSKALSRELGVLNAERCYMVTGGYAGIFGKLPAPINLDAIAERVKQVTGVNDIHDIRRNDGVQKIGVVAGGTGIDGIKEMTALGCDTFITGTYYNLIQNEIGKRNREEFEQYRSKLKINLIECSHYASEAVVMRCDIVKFCRRFEMECEFLPQDDPWY